MYGKKMNKMRSIVRHWKKFTSAHQRRYTSLARDREMYADRTDDCFKWDGGRRSDTSDSYNGSPRSVRHLARSTISEDVPEGCLALYVGRERRKFIIGAHYLEHNLFHGLLERSAAEFESDQNGGILIACEIVLFEHLLWLIGTDDPSSRHLQVDELLDFYAY
ncbi:SAUR family protein [Marchantia polymorpha subsp. ruderalis]|nr:hypothetical protein MARPO_0047s0021 [Marchantia polymorpha]BBN14691.1 hypothetical protein Mp_6g13700 [Marchantia polymorpha subsp. ruderalis]|eukprot:PTQ39029.1 hypothetical protein MARPO_0047s0021 [Marchantia polymorpha]